jgi:serum/glucocorticoid-regulated kinase 2
MLVKDRKERLGQRNDVDEILTHPWFADIDIDDVKHKRMPSPYIPKIDGNRDLSNFDPEMTNQTLKESILPEASVNIILDKKDAFKDFGPIIK